MLFVRHAEYHKDANFCDGRPRSDVPGRLVRLGGRQTDSKAIALRFPTQGLPNMRGKGFRFAHAHLYMIRLLAFAATSMLALAETPVPRISLPSLGYVFDENSKAIRQISGVPGAASL